MRAAPEAGGVALAALFGALAAGGVAVLLVGVATEVGAAAARARTAADAAALAGAAASPLLGGDGAYCREAARAAAANDAALLECRTTARGGDVPATVVSVRVSVAGGLRAGPLPAVEARAAAAARPRAPPDGAA